MNPKMEWTPEDLSALSALLTDEQTEKLGYQYGRLARLEICLHAYRAKLEKGNRISETLPEGHRLSDTMKGILAGLADATAWFDEIFPEVKEEE